MQPTIKYKNMSGFLIKFYPGSHARPPRDLCKTSPFAQLLRQAQILSLEILNVFLRLKFSPSLNLSKIEHFSKVSPRKRSVAGRQRH